MALMLMAISNIAVSCPAGRGWETFSFISFMDENAGLLTLARFSDGLYAKVEDEKSIKEMYQLKNDLYLYKGYIPSKQAGPSPFSMLDMPVGMVVTFLGQYFKQPCSVSAIPTPFTYVFTSGGVNIDVSGSAHLVGESIVAFDLTAIEKQEHGASIKASGEVDFSDINPLPPDMAISNWVIVRGGGIGTPAEIIEPDQKVMTVRDLRTLIQ